MRVVIVGGGWAGLAAAVTLCQRDVDVTLIEAAAQLGGRARKVEHHGLPFDNGQHLLIGAYREFLRLLALIGVAEDSVLIRTPLRWLMRHPGGAGVDIRAPRLPAPLHMTWALLHARGFNYSERLAALRACAHVLRPPGAADDITVAAWLQRTRQTQRVIDMLWSPLCLAALNTPIASASAAVFTRVLRDAFLHARADSDLLIPRRDLGAVFPEPAAAFIRRHGGRIIAGERARALISDDACIRGVRGTRGDYSADAVILAVPPQTCIKLIADQPALTALAANLNTLESEPICTAYLHYAPAIPLSAVMNGMAGMLGHWLFDLAPMDKPGWVAIVISGPGEHMHLDNEQLLTALRQEIAGLWPSAAQFQEGFVIREKRATFSCRAGIDALRPPLRTALPGCWLAGDHTATGYPSTLEGAVRSGVQCAEEILRDKAAR